jgi:hypothetical protein
MSVSPVAQLFVYAPVRVDVGQGCAARIRSVSGAGDPIGAFRPGGVPISLTRPEHRPIGGTIRGLPHRGFVHTGRLRIPGGQTTPAILKTSRSGEAGIDMQRDLNDTLVFVKAVQKREGNLRGWLCVTAPYPLGTGLLGPLLHEFRSRYPDVHVEIVRRNDIRDLVKRGLALTHAGKGTAMALGPDLRAHSHTASHVRSPSRLILREQPLATPSCILAVWNRHATGPSGYPREQLAAHPRMNPVWTDAVTRSGLNPLSIS